MSRFPEIYKAVKDARRPDGIFTAAAGQSFIHPNKEAAELVMDCGVILMEKVPFMAMARPLSPYQKDIYNLAKEQVGIDLDFLEVYVMDSPQAYMMTFGGYLLLDEDALTDRHFSAMLAHELAHLLNGDSFVRAAFYFLGKGWLQESVTPLGIVQESDAERTKRISDDWSDVIRSALIGGWRGGGIMLAAKMIRGVGSSVKSFDADVSLFFQRWDIEADAKAEDWIGVLEYQSYLADWRDNGHRFAFDAPTSIRLEESERRQRPNYRPTMQPTNIHSFAPLWKTVGMSALVILGLLLLTAVMMISNALN